MIKEPGIFRDMTPAEYFEGFTPAPGLSNSMMTKLLTETPKEAAFHHPMLNPDKEMIAANADMRMGDVVHQLALGKGRGYAIVDAPNFTTVAGKAGKAAALELGLTPICAPKFAEAEKMADVVRERIRQTLRDIGLKRGLPEPHGGWPYETELVIAWQEHTPHGPIWLHGMLDVWCADLLVILDPKVTKALRDPNVTFHMAKQAWDRQGVLYPRGMGAVMPEHAGRITFANLMVCPAAPYVSRAIGCSIARQSIVSADIEKAIELFARCLSFNTWPGYPDGIELLDPTPGQVRLAMEAEMINEEEE